MRNRVLSVIIIVLLQIFIIEQSNSESVEVQQEEVSIEVAQNMRRYPDEVLLYGGVSEILYMQYEPIIMETDTIEQLYITDEEREELARIIMCEAEGEDLDGKILVGNVVLNRINSDDFPDDIISVIRQRSGDEYQFSPVKSGRIDRVIPSEECYDAIDRLLEGYDISQGALYFESCKNEDNWHSRNLEFLFKHGRHRFYK